MLAPDFPRFMCVCLFSLAALAGFAPRAQAQDAVAPAEPPTGASPGAYPSVVNQLEPPQALQLPQPNGQPVTATLDAPRAVMPRSIAPDLRGMMAEYLTVEERMANVQEELKRRSLGWPIRLTVIGAAVGTSFLFASLLQHSTMQQIQTDIRKGHYDRNDDLNGDGDIDSKDVNRARNSQWALLGVGVAMLGVAVGGIVWLTRRMGQRRPWQLELAGLRERHTQLQQGLRLDLGLTASGGSVRLTY